MTLTVHDKPTDPKPGCSAVPPVLTRKGVAELLQVSIRTVDRLNIKSTLLGYRTRRFLTKHVLEHLDRRAQ